MESPYSLSTPMCLVTGLAFNEDVFGIIAPYITNIKGLVHLFHSNKSFSRLLDESNGHTRRVFIDLATTITSYPSKGFVPSAIAEILHAIHDRRAFMQHIRALVCVWTNTPVHIPVRDLSTELPTSRYLNVMDDAAMPTLVISSPETPERYFSVTGTEDPVYTTTRIMTHPYPIFVEETRLQQNPDAFFEEIQSQLEHPLDMNEFTGNFREGQVYNYFPIHGAVFAVVSSYNGHDIERLPEHENGIYYFSIPEGRMLCHRGWPVSAFKWESFIQSRPFQLWVLTPDRLYHMNVVGDSDAPGEFIASSHEERIDPAMSLVAKGELESALTYMSDAIGCYDINTKAQFNGRTMMHYAAIHGQPHVVDMLLEMNADPFLLDLHSISPLQLAVRRLQHESVCLLACGMVIPYQVWNDSWSELCKGSVLKNCFEANPDMVHEYCSVSIPDIVQLLWNNRPPTNAHRDEVWISLAARSYTILSSEGALEFILTLGPSPGQPYPIDRFSAEGAFKSIFSARISPQHDREMLKALRMAVRMYGMDINTRAGASRETYLIAAIRHGTARAVKVLIEELGADVTALSNGGSDIKTMAIERCFSTANITPERRQEANKIASYIISKTCPSSRLLFPWT